MRRLLPLLAVAAAQEDFGNMFGAAPARDATRGMPHAGDGATETLSTRRRDATRHHAGQQKYCAPYKCPKEKEAVQNRLSFKAKKGGCDALNSGAGMQMRGSRVPSHSNKGPSSFFGGRRHVHASTP